MRALIAAAMLLSATGASANGPLPHSQGTGNNSAPELSGYYDFNQRIWVRNYDNRGDCERNLVYFADYDGSGGYDTVEACVPDGDGNYRLTLSF